MQPPGKRLRKIYILGSGHMTKMATMSIYGENLKKSSYQQPLAASRPRGGREREKYYIFGPGHMTKLAAMPIDGKNPKKHFSLEPLG